MPKYTTKTTEYLGEVVHQATLESGLNVYILPKKHFAKKYAFFATQYGGLYNDYLLNGEEVHVPQGTAHFLEHQIFEDRQKSNFEKFEELGASLNAYTSATSTVYHFDTVDNFETCLKLLLDMVQSTDISDDSVAKEKEVIAQEILMYMDEPTWELYNNLYEGLFHVHPIKSEIAGTVESIGELTKETILDCYHHFYTPGNMSLFLYGDIEIEETLILVDDLLSPQYKQNPNKPELILPVEPYEIHKKRFDITKDISKGMVVLGFKGNPDLFNEQKEDKQAALKLALDMMFGRSSRFFLECYEKGYVTEHFDFDLQLGLGHAIVIIGNETDHIEELYQATLDEVKRCQENGFDEMDFIRIKRKILGRTVSSFNSLQSIAGNLTHSIMRGNDLFRQMDAYKHVTLEQINQIINVFIDVENHVVSTMQKTPSKEN